MIAGSSTFDSSTTSTFCNPDCTLDDNTSDIIYFEGVIVNTDDTDDLTTGNINGSLDFGAQYFDGSIYKRTASKKYTAASTETSYVFNNTVISGKPYVFRIIFETTSNTPVIQVNKAEYQFFAYCNYFLTSFQASKPHMSYDRASQNSPYTTPFLKLTYNSFAYDKETRFRCNLSDSSEFFTFDYTPTAAIPEVNILLKQTTSYEKLDCFFYVRISATFILYYENTLHVNVNNYNALSVQSGFLETQVGANPSVSFTFKDVLVDPKRIVPLEVTFAEVYDVIHSCTEISYTKPTNSPTTITFDYDLANEKLIMNFSEISKAGKYSIHFVEKSIDLYVTPATLSPTNYLSETIPTTATANTPISFKLLFVDSYGNPTYPTGSPGATFEYASNPGVTNNLTVAVANEQNFDGNKLFSKCYQYSFTPTQNSNLTVVMDTFSPPITLNMAMSIPDCASSGQKIGPDNVCYSDCAASSYPFTAGNECLSDCTTHATLKYTRGSICDTACDPVEFEGPGKVCVASCISEFGGNYSFNYDKKCVSPCPTGFEKYHSTTKECVADCKTSFDLFTLQGVCVTGCDSTYPNHLPDDKVCVDSCKTAHTSTFEYTNINICKNACDGDKPYYNDGNKICYSACSSSAHHYTSGNQCYSSCPSGVLYFGSAKLCMSSCGGSEIYADGYECKTACPSGKEYYDENNVCYGSCGDIGSGYVYKIDKRCYTSCPSGSQYYDSTGECRSVCPSGEEYSLGFECLTDCPPDYLVDPNKKCYATTCPTSFPFKDGLNCLDECPNSRPYYDPAKVCYDKCPLDSPMLVGDECLSKCPGNQVYAADLVCRDECPSHTTKRRGTKCLVVCSPGERALEDTLQCSLACPSDYPYYDSEYCYKQCPADKLVSQNECVDSCPDSRPLLHNKVCNTECPSTHPKIVENTCKLECPSDLPYFYEANCFETCPTDHPYFDPSQSQKECLTTCDKFRTSSKYCLDECPLDFPFHYKNVKLCLQTCRFFYTDQSECLDECDSTRPLEEIRGNQSFCVSDCSDGKLKYKDTCIEECPLFSVKTDTECTDCLAILHENKCINNCPSGMKMIQSCSTCQKLCAACSILGMVEHKGICVSECPFPLIAKEGKCQECPLFNREGSCVDACTPPALPIPSKKLCLTCIDGYIENGKCIEKCNSHVHLSEGVEFCVDCKGEYFYKGECYPECPPGTDIVAQRKTCIKKVENCGLDQINCMHSSTCVQINESQAKCRCLVGYTSLNCQHPIADVPKQIREQFIDSLEPTESFSSDTIYKLRSIQIELANLPDNTINHVFSLIQDYFNQSININNGGVFLLMDIYLKFSK